MPPSLAFQDFAPGRTFAYPGPTPTKDEIVAFGQAFDPQPFHTDEEAAKATFVGGLIASGWHSCALLMRAMVDNVLADSTSMGAPGVEAVRWLKPVRPGDTLSVHQTVLDTRTSAKRPEMGLVQIRSELLNQSGEAVLEMQNWGMFGRRDAGTASAPEDAKRSGDALPSPSRGEPALGLRPEEVGGGGGADSTAAAPSGTTPLSSSPPQEGREMAAPFFDDLRVGNTADLGEHTFEPAAIIRFARAFDPQPFHTDPEAARRSHFGALCASGWHTAALCMRLIVEERRRAAREAAARGEPAPQLGPSPGFTDLRWLKPVYAGDTLRFASTIVETRPSASRPGWGLVSSRNAGVNQRGEEVFSFVGSVFWERRGESGEA